MQQLRTSGQMAQPASSLAREKSGGSSSKKPELLVKLLLLGDSGVCVCVCVCACVCATCGCVACARMMWLWYTNQYVHLNPCWVFGCWVWLAGVGKTSLISRYADNKFNPGTIMTAGYGTHNVLL